jgi:hypothetical protein
VSQVLGVALETLKHHAPVRDYLKDIVNRYKQHNQAVFREIREAEIMAAIPLAAEAVNARDGRVTREAVLREIGVSARQISRYRSARALLSEVVSQG